MQAYSRGLLSEEEIQLPLAVEILALDPIRRTSNHMMQTIHQLLVLAFQGATPDQCRQLNSTSLSAL